MEIPHLVSDLAIMLTTAAVVTMLFRRLRIPAILGYILAGFLIGPHFPYFLDVASKGSIEIWSEIGVTIILFHIGLEFDFHKLTEVGSTAIVSAAVKMCGVSLVGYGAGLLLGMNTMDSIFLGAMLSISSTVVIQKCFAEMGLEKENYARLVMGSLVMEDVISVFMMVVLTTISADHASSGLASSFSMLMMVAYLILWLVAGIYLVPTFLDKGMSLMNDETLTLLSIGFCFLMALLAHRLGFSSELGAFVAGSLFAGTRHSHDIERVTAGIKDMFGAVFFLSVGMLVDPEIIVTRWTSIVPIAIIAVIAKLIFATVGMMLSGQDMETSMKGGISLAPIGEFSFIIAGLGISLGVMDEYLYPVIVASSIITIILTPVLIRQSDRLVAAITSIIPEKLRLRIDSYTSDDQTEEEESSVWKAYFKEYLLQLIIYGSIMLVLMVLIFNHLSIPVMKYVGYDAGAIIILILIDIVIAIFAVPMMRNRSRAFTDLWLEKLSNRPPLVVMTIIKILVIELIAMLPLLFTYDFDHILILGLIPLSIIVIARSHFITSYYLRLETRFFANLNQKTMDARGGARSEQNWLDEDYSIFSWIVPEGASYAGKALADLHWGRNYSVYVVKIRRGDKRIPMPPGRSVIHEGDMIHVIGERPSLRTFYKALETDQQVNIRTLREFLETDYPDEKNALACAAIMVRGTESYAGKQIRNSGINHRSNCMILGLERDGYALKMPPSSMLILKGDILWIVGTRSNLGSIAAHSVGKAGSHEDGGLYDSKDSGEESRSEGDKK